MTKLKQTPHIFIDADACPVREEIYKVAKRLNVAVIVVSNSYLRIAAHSLISQQTVSNKMDAADDYIAERANLFSVVITADILLAERCLKNDAVVIAPNGKAFTKDSIGGIVATRAIMNDLRAGAVGENIGGPAAFGPKDRSRFLQSLHDCLVKLQKIQS